MDVVEVWGLGIACMIWRFWLRDGGWGMGSWVDGWVTCVMNYGVWVGRYPLFFVSLLLNGGRRRWRLL